MDRDNFWGFWLIKEDGGIGRNDFPGGNVICNDAGMQLDFLGSKESVNVLSPDVELVSLEGEDYCNCRAILIKAVEPDNARVNCLLVRTRDHHKSGESASNS